jgi:transcriptional regulator with XRE-family HTH domain
MVMASEAEIGLGVLAENVRRLRRERRLSLDTLAAASGIGRATIARLEAGRANPTIETLYEVANALGVPLGALLTTESDRGASVQVVRAGEATRIKGTLEAELLGRLYGFGFLELMLIHFPSGRRRKAAPHPPGVVEHLLVISGTIEAGPVAATVRLNPGDYIRFSADVPHTYVALDGDAQAVAVMGYPAAPGRSDLPARA